MESESSSFIAQSLEASLTVADVVRSRDWYRDALGFIVEREHLRAGKLMAVSLRAGNVQVLLSQDNGAKGFDRVKGEGFSLQFTTTQDVDAVAARAERAGAALQTPPFDAFGARAFRLRDPDGFLLVISSVRSSP